MIMIFNSLNKNVHEDIDTLAYKLHIFIPETKFVTQPLLLKQSLQSLDISVCKLSMSDVHHSLLNV